jgi:hypothetical protein
MPDADAGITSMLLACLDRANVRGFLTLGTRTALKRNALVLGKAFETVSLDIAKVGEEIGATVVRLDEAKAFGIVKPFYGASLCSHYYFPSVDSLDQ